MALRNTFQKRKFFVAYMMIAPESEQNPERLAGHENCALKTLYEQSLMG